LSLLDLIPKERLLNLKEEMSKNRRKSREGLFSLIRKNLNCSPTELKKFKYTVNNHLWEGVIYLKRNNLMGTIFSYYDKKVFIVRGYPKIKYSEESKVLNNYAVCQEKIDGTNLGIFLFPDGTLMGKTRMTERFDKQGYKDRRWYELLKETGLEDNVMKLLTENPYFQIFGELYGQKNPGDFIRYNVPIAFKVFDIFNTNTYSFTHPKMVEDMCKQYDLPFVKTMWKGELTLKEVQRLEFELKDEVKEDGMEGIMAKYWDEKDKDVYFAKLKCEGIKELCWELSPRMVIPRAIIKKAVKKAWDNQGILETTDDIFSFVIAELKEEADEGLIVRSKDRIKEIIYAVFTPVEGQDKLWSYFKELEGKGIDFSNIGNKNKILSLAASKFIGISPDILYKSYMTYFHKKE